MTDNMNIPIVPEDAKLPQVEFEITMSGCTGYEGQPRSTVTIKIDATHLPDILRAMENFLRGMDFRFTGHLEIVDEEA